MNNDPKNKKPQDNKPQNGDDGRQGRRIIFLMVAALIATLLINSLYTTIANAYLSEITYNEFQTYLDKDEIAELEFQSDRMVILTRDEAKKPSSQQRLYYTGYIPNVSNDDLKARLDAQGVEYNTEIVEQASPIVTFVVTWLLPVIIMYALFSLLMRGMTKKMGGGLGGGSSNAATVLVALNHLWQCGLSMDELAEMGLTLGADVPVFVRGHAAFAEGVGEILTPVDPPEKWYLVAHPGVSIPTPVIFKDPELPRNTPKRSIETLLKCEFSNDCEVIARKRFREVDAVLSWLLEYAPSRLTGTGACVFAEFDTESEARQVLEQAPEWLNGFVAKGVNLSPLHRAML